MILSCIRGVHRHNIEKSYPLANSYNNAQHIGLYKFVLQTLEFETRLNLYLNKQSHG